MQDADRNRQSQGLVARLDGEHLRIGIVQARFNAQITERMAQVCLDELHALGVDTVAIRIPRYPRVRRADASKWPGVRGGRYALGEALAVFDRYFRADNPPLAETAPLALIEDEAPRWRRAA